MRPFMSICFQSQPLVFLQANELYMEIWQIMTVNNSYEKVETFKYLVSVGLLTNQIHTFKKLR